VSRAVVSAKGWPICALTLVGLNAEFDEPQLSELKRHLHDATAELQDALTTLTSSGQTLTKAGLA
jgi:DNA-binding IclR family transcriptional regulator